MHLFYLKKNIKIHINIAPTYSVFDHHQGACTEPGQSHIYIKTFGEITSLFIMRYYKYNLSQVQCKVPDDGRRPKYVGAIFMCILE